MRPLLFLATAAALFLLGPFSHAVEPPAEVLGIAPDARRLDENTIAGARNYLTGYAALDAQGRVRVVVEIPAGDSQKWEVVRIEKNPAGLLKREFRWFRPAAVAYLPHPANYGMVPGTRMPEREGGDGDPLDALVLGPALPRGHTAAARPIGVLRLHDEGQRDDKVLAVTEDSPFAEIENLEELERKFPGVMTILETWYSSYKGAGKIRSLGFGDAKEAKALIETARSHHAARSRAADR